MSRIIRVSMALTVLLFLSGCYEEEARHALEAAGYTEILQAPSDWTASCGRGGGASNVFYARSPAGRRLELVACGTPSMGFQFAVRGRAP